MSLFTPKCTRKGCEWVGTPKDTQAKANQAVAMHIGRQHSKLIPTYRGGPVKQRAHVHGNGHGTAVAELRTPLSGSARGRKHVVEDQAKPQKRKYTRKQPVPAPVGTDVQVEHCWKCGASIGALAEGIVLAELMRKDAHIRAKVEKILAET